MVTCLWVIPSYCEHTVAIPGRGDEFPVIICFIPCGNTYQDTLSGCGGSASCSHTGMAIHIFVKIALIRVAKRATDHLRPMLLRPFRSGNPGVFLVFIFGCFSLGSRQEKFSVRGKAHRIAVIF